MRYNELNMINLKRLPITFTNYVLRKNYCLNRASHCDLNKANGLYLAFLNFSKSLVNYWSSILSDAINVETSQFMRQLLHTCVCVCVCVLFKKTK